MEKHLASYLIFNLRLDTTQRYLLANSICEGLENKTKQEARSGLVRVIAGENPSSQLNQKAEEKNG